MLLSKNYRSLLSVALLAVCAPVLASAQTTPTAPRQGAEPAAQPQVKVLKTETTNSDFWTTTCNTFDDAQKTRRCVARLPVIRGDNRSLVVVLSAARNAENKLTLTIDVPTSISLLPGGSITLDGAGEPRKFPFESCVPAGCTGTLPLDEQFLTQLTTAKTASVSWTSLEAGQVKFDFELKGAKQAIDALGS